MWEFQTKCGGSELLKWAEALWIPETERAKWHDWKQKQRNGGKPGVKLESQAELSGTRSYTILGSGKTLKCLMKVFCKQIWLNKLPATIARRYWMASGNSECEWDLFIRLLQSAARGGVTRNGVIVFKWLYDNPWYYRWNTIGYIHHKLWIRRCWMQRKDLFSQHVVEVLATILSFLYRENCASAC